MSLKTGRQIGAVDSTLYDMDYRKRGESGSVKVTVDQADFGGKQVISLGDLVCVEGFIGFACADVEVESGETETEDLVLQTERARYELDPDQLDGTGTYTTGKALFADITDSEAVIEVTDDHDGNRFIGVVEDESDGLLSFFLEPFVGIGIEAAAYSG